jgi:hypothetical protein
MGFLMSTDGLFVDRICCRNANYEQLHFKILEDNNGTVSVLEKMRYPNAKFLVTAQESVDLYSALQTNKKYRIEVEVFFKQAKGDYKAGVGLRLLHIHGLRPQS